MHIGKTLNTSYKMEISTFPGSSIELSEVNFEKDLGIWTTSPLKPSLHCDKAAANATKFLRMLKRTFSAISRELSIFLYKTYVRPLLEYCIQLRCPYLAQDIDTLERVQRRATKLVCGLADLPYESRLRKLGIYSLFCRRQRSDLTETYKLLNGYYDVNWTKFFMISPVQNTRGHHMKLYKKLSKLQLRSNFFTQRVINMWNQLPATVVSASTVSLFKHELDEYWTSSGYGYVRRPGA